MFDINPKSMDGEGDSSYQDEETKTTRRRQSNIPTNID